VNNELMDVGRAFGSLNQSFQTQGQMGNQNGMGGSSFNSSNNGANSDIMSGGMSMSEQ
jgi:hypothetical protein